MPAGAATGPARRYQEECRDLLLRHAAGAGLVPYEGDGIDVRFQLGVAPVRLDVALRGPDGRLVVAECKRYRKEDPIEQGLVKQFAYDVERLRATQAVEVAGFFLTTSSYQIGALRTAFEPGIQMVLFASGQQPSGLIYSYFRYDPVREQRIKDAFVSFVAASVHAAASSASVVRADPTSDDPALGSAIRAIVGQYARGDVGVHDMDRQLALYVRRIACTQDTATGRLYGRARALASELGYGLRTEAEVRAQLRHALAEH